MASIFDKWFGKKERNLHDIIEEESEEIVDEPTKREIKQKAKSLIKNKFKVGDKYYLRSKSVTSGRTSNVREFIIRKVIYTINNEIVNSLIVKELTPIESSIFTLNKYDCKKLHIKFEEGLQVYPMDMIWVKKNEMYE